MQKRLLVYILISLLIISNVYSLSLFPTNNKDTIYNNIKLDKVSIKDNYIELLITSNTNVDNLIINVDKETINLPITINKYESKLINFYTNTTNPTSLIIYFYKNTNHKLVEINRISYTFTGNEDNPVNKQDIPILKQENNQLLLDDNPDYISYSSISKLTNNKEITYYTRDHISSNRITTNNQGNTVYQANFQPYGNIFTEEGTEKYKFSNKELDSSNLYYFGARYYNSNTGRFTQVDPIFNPSISPYSYANNNPLKYIDPTGKEETEFRNPSEMNFQSNSDLPNILPFGFIGPQNHNDIRSEDLFGYDLFNTFERDATQVYPQDIDFWSNIQPESIPTVPITLSETMYRDFDLAIGNYPEIREDSDVRRQEYVERNLLSFPETQEAWSPTITVGMPNQKVPIIIGAIYSKQIARLLAGFRVKLNSGTVIRILDVLDALPDEGTVIRRATHGVQVTTPRLTTAWRAGELSRPMMNINYNNPNSVPSDLRRALEVLGFR